MALLLPWHCFYAYIQYHIFFSVFLLLLLLLFFYSLCLFYCLLHTEQACFVVRMDGMCMNWRASRNKMAIQVPNEICFSAQRTISCVFVRPHIAKHKNSLRCYNRDKSHLIIIVMCSNVKIRIEIREQKREHFPLNAQTLDSRAYVPRRKMNRRK